MGRGPSHLAEVFGGDPIIITAGKLVHKRQHLVLCPDELRLDGAAWSTQEAMGARSLGKQPSRPCPGHMACPPPLQPHSLDFVLRVGFATATLHLCRVQQGVLPDGVGPVAGKRVHHLWGRDAKQECPLCAGHWGKILPKCLLQLETPLRLLQCAWYPVSPPKVMCPV